MYGERMERLEVGHPFPTAAGGKQQRVLQHDPTSLMVFGTTCFPLEIISLLEGLSAEQVALWSCRWACVCVRSLARTKQLDLLAGPHKSRACTFG